MSLPFPTLLVSRRPRQVDVDWTGARSWLGGAPRIGAVPWPRDKKAQPLLFVAQIDLAEVAAKTSKTPLPDKGSLAFFIGGGSAVVFVPEGQTNTPVMPPAGTPDLIECGGAPEWRTDLEGRPLFPYWPVDFAVLDVTPPASDEHEDAWEEFAAAEVTAVGKLFPRRKYGLTADQGFAGPSIPDWWQTAIYYANYLDKALLNVPTLIRREQGALEHALKKVDEAQSKDPNELKKAKAYVAICESKIATLHQLQPSFVEFAAEVSGFSKGCDPWVLMTPDEMAHLASLWARNSQFAAFHSNQGKFPIDYLKNEMFKALPAADTPAFAAFPAPVRDLIDQKRAPRPQWWFMAVHYAKRLQEAARLGVPMAAKWRLDNIAAYRKRINELQPKDVLAVFRRITGPKSADVTKLEAEMAKAEAELAKLGSARGPVQTVRRRDEKLGPGPRSMEPDAANRCRTTRRTDETSTRGVPGLRRFLRTSSTRRAGNPSPHHHGIGRRTGLRGAPRTGPNVDQPGLPAANGWMASNVWKRGRNPGRFQRHARTRLHHAAAADARRSDALELRR
jgi:Domain of unknown function (DUF1963)